MPASNVATPPYLDVKGVFFEISVIEISDVSLVHLFPVFHVKRHVLVPFVLVKFGGVDHRSFKVRGSVCFCR